jgi:hypothetical protein
MDHNNVHKIVSVCVELGLELGEQPRKQRREQGFSQHLGEPETDAPAQRFARSGNELHDLVLVCST